MGESLRAVINEIKFNGYKFNENLVERALQALSIRATGARVVHTRFGVGTVLQPLGEYYIAVRFDKYGTRYVAMHKLISLDIIVQREIEKSKWNLY